MAIITEIVNIQVDPTFTLASSIFAGLRNAASDRGVKEQYYGFDMDKPNQLVWVIHWPADSRPTGCGGPEGSFREALKELDVNKAPNTVCLPFDSPDVVRPAFTAPVCELCFVHIVSASDTPDLSHSLEKTFTDCYFAEGFKGGYWAKDVNDNKMNFYCLGWESRQAHLEYFNSELCDEELKILRPYMDGGLAVFVEKLVQQLS